LRSPLPTMGKSRILPEMLYAPMISTRLSTISWWLCFLSKSNLESMRRHYSLTAHAGGVTAFPEQLRFNQHDYMCHLYPNRQPVKSDWIKLLVRTSATLRFFHGYHQSFQDGTRSILKLGQFSIHYALIIMPFTLCGVSQWFSKWTVPLPLRARCSLIYDWSDFRQDTGKLVSLHQAHPSRSEFTKSEVVTKCGNFLYCDYLP
jgi:hypothetical protein